MQISELSDRSGVSIASIKYYLREGLLPAGASIAANRATYDDQHLRRLRLIRALIDIGELPVAGVRTVLRCIDNDTVTLHDAFGAVMHGLDPAPPATEATALDEVNGWILRRQWTIHAEAPAIASLANLLVTLRGFGIPVSVDDLNDAADLAERSGEFEVAYARAMADRTAAVETMLIGTVVLERALTEVRRLALEAVSARAESTSAQPGGRPNIAGSDRSS